jgi:hypothetical protein
MFDDLLAAYLGQAETFGDGDVQGLSAVMGMPDAAPWV